MSSRGNGQAINFGKYQHMSSLQNSWDMSVKTVNLFRITDGSRKNHIFRIKHLNWKRWKFDWKY